MNDQAKSEIDKRQIEATVLFAINHVPHVNQATLERFLELVNTTGSHGAISDRQLIKKMTLLTKHVPGTCQSSLLTLCELLDINLPRNSDDLLAAL